MIEKLVSILRLFATASILRQPPRQKSRGEQELLTVIEKDRMLILIPHASLDELRGIAAGVRTDNHREKKDRFA